MHFFSTLFLLSSSLLPLASAVSQTGPAAAVASPDGLIVPFSTKLPACASLCGKLFDVQGACTPPNIAAVSQSCFCTDGRLTPFLQPGTAGVSSVCGPESCQDATSLGEIQSWYEGYCNEKSSNPTTTSSSTTSGAPTATGTGSDSQGTHVAHSGGGYTWVGAHYRWIIMIIVVGVGLILIWIAAILIRRRYIRKKEKEIEMRPPVAWGPHQMQGMTGGYGDGIMDMNHIGPVGPVVDESKIIVADVAPTNSNSDQSSGSGLRKHRS